MADTMKFGPEWLRALSDGPNSTAPVLAPSSKFKMADYRYGREEMLALFQPPYKAPAYIQQFSQIYVEDTQTPICLLPLSEDEERLMALGVNSMRTSRGGGVPLRGGRGGAVDRGRGRGRGRGELYSIRGPMENGDIGGGFGRPRGPNKDGWEEVGNRKLDRGYSRPFEEVEREGHPRYSRSMSSENWRDKGPVGPAGPAEEEDDGDWRKTGSRDRWATRTSWREPGRGGVEIDRHNGAFSRGRGFKTDDRGRRLGHDDVPEWADDGADEMGTFDSSGAFVSNKERPHFYHDHRAERDPSRELADPPQDKEAARPERREPPPQAQAEPRQQQEESPPRRNDSSSRLSTSSQLSNGTVPSPRQGSGGPSSPAPPQQENGVSAQVASLVAAAVSAAPMLPSMPQGVTLANIIMDEKTEPKNAAATSLTDENALKWLYTDPQGAVQGPFLAEEMAQWFSAGYFTMNLLVKRGCDEQFQPLGELMKRWGHVPFLPGTPPPPLLKTAPAAEPVPVSTPPVVTLQAPAPTPTPSFTLAQGGGSTETLLAQQQLLLQHQILQVQMSMRQLQMQTLAGLQEQETFKALDPPQQQQLSLQMMQSNPLVLQHMQQLQQLQALQQHSQQQQTSQGQSQPTSAAAAATLQQQTQPPQSGVDVSLSASSPIFNRSVSQPPPTNEGNWSNSQPGSVWELENTQVPQTVKSDMEKLRQEKEAEFARMLEAERKRQEEIQKQQDELRRQTEALQRERERMEKEKDELERQRQLDLQRVEETRRLEGEEQKRRQMQEAEEERLRHQKVARQRQAEEQRRKEEEQRMRDEDQRREEELQKRQEEEERKTEEMRRKRDAEEKALEELKRMEETRRQQEGEKQRLRDAEKQQQEAEAQRKQQQEFQRQQQEALKRLQQQQAMQNIQLPSSANWARQRETGGSGQSRPLAEIQQEEEIKQLQQQKERQELMRIQQEHLSHQQQLQQQQQKSWASNLAAQQSSRGKSLAEIQEEQERQLQQERKKQQQQNQQQAKVMSLSQAAVWGAGPPSIAPSAPSTPWSAGIWGGDAPTWGSAPVAQSAPAPSAKRSGKDNTIGAEFPALRTPKASKAKQPAAKSAPAQPKPKKEEEAVQRLFKGQVQSKDEFTLWCETFLSTMETQIDVETFVSFLQAVESPYEVHDYVKNYLGEGKNAREFGKQFLEKRSHYKNKARNEKRQEEESIWGPAPALNPREGRGAVQPSASDGFTEVGSKAKGGKKKKKMQKLDCSTMLGFTVEKDPNRKNAGEIEGLE
ncbi:GRB10-interacting GYF protein 2-like isoform X2 [Littorina saxatilis]|uniref:GRB10-interacting GYF protein 2-like isoform X2 n=1 Tax=Littorina saxatilis TaxID=31220 RepID=UPI0038B5A7B0